MTVERQTRDMIPVASGAFLPVDETMDRFHAMKVFVAVADAGSFARAAQHLRLSPPAVTRTIAQLEDRIGAPLMTRTTRSLTLTEAGMRFLESSKRLLVDLEEAERSAGGEVAAPAGHLNVTASVTLGRTHVTEVVAQYLAATPRVSVSLLLHDRIVNIVEEGIDIAVRIGELADSSLVGRKVGTVRRQLVASPSYLDRRGWPDRPEDLKLHDIIAFTGLLPNREWRFTDKGRQASVALSPRFEVNDAVSALSCALEGYGVTIALSYMVADAIRAGRLEPVLDEITPPPAPVQLVYPKNRIVAAKVRSFLDFAAPRLSRRLGELAS